MEYNKPEIANAIDLSEVFGKSESLQDGDTLASVNWFQQISRVRENVKRLDDVFLYTETNTFFAICTFS